jgi:hypothetical protein
MTKARWETVSDAGGTRANEDLVAVFERAGTTDVLVLDGATSLVDGGQDVEGGGGNADVVWFVQRFAAEFERLLDTGAPRTALLGLAAEATGRAWDGRGGGRNAAPWAWPVASLSWLRVTPRTDGEGHAGHLTSLGDCKTVLRLADGSVCDLDPFDNPQETSLYAEVAALIEAGVIDPTERFARLLPSLRARRTAQNLNPAPAVLGVRPQGPFAVRERAFDLGPGSTVVAMTDGFWRLVDPYGVMTAEQLLDACHRDGLQAVLARLREVERGAGGAASLAVKRADDASAVAWHAPTDIPA